MAHQPQDMFTIAMGGGSVRRAGDVVVLAMAGSSMVTTRQDMQKAQCWARSKATTGNAVDDRHGLVAQLDTLIAGLDSGYGTRGPNLSLCRLVRGMQSNGMDLAPWSIPQPVLDELAPPPPPAVRTPVARRGT